MKKEIVAFAVYLICALTGNSSAEQLQMKMHSFEIGPEASFIQYVEPDVMKETGYMVGAAGSYAYHNNLMLKAEGKASYGMVYYENSGTIDNIPNYMFEGRLMGGFDFPVLEASIVTPYIGVGYRYLVDDAGGKVSSTGAGGYKRESNYYYSPIGIETLTSLKNEWYVGIVLEYDHFWKGRQVSHIGDVNPSVGTIKNDQNDGYGLRGSIRFKKEGNFSYVLEPFARYWNIDDSEVVDTWIEPKNHSTEVGLKFIFSF